GGGARRMPTSLPAIARRSRPLLARLRRDRHGFDAPSAGVHDRARSMPARFCPQCGTPAAPRAKFCIERGVRLDGTGSAAAATGRRLPGLGAGVLGFIVVAGLGIWTAILSPAPPRPGPGASAARSTGPAPGPAAALPEGHPKAAALPHEAKEFIDDLAARANE